MKIIGLDSEEISEIHRILSVILWLGNINFTEGENDNSIIENSDIIDFLSYLLECENVLLEKTLTIRVMETKRGGKRGSIYDVPLNVTQATANKDTIAKILYNRLFEWIIQRINEGLGNKLEGKIIGILDIYGFEIFESNKFEQLCINYVNEKLQQIFIELTLKLEQEEYVNERIEWMPIDFFNNKIVCDLIEEKRPPGIFAALNDACATAHADPLAADKSFNQKLNGIQHNNHLELRGELFCIKHYAGDVYYDVEGMTDKNKDQISKDILILLKSSDNHFVNNLFPEEIEEDNKKRVTSSDKIKSSAQALVSKLMKSKPSYIRCIKSNENKSSEEFDQQRVMHQVKYLGLCENIRVRRAGFAYRIEFEKFLERFFLLSSKLSYAGELTYKGDSKSGCSILLSDLSIDIKEWQLGITKVFIRKPEVIFYLENERDLFWHKKATIIQRQYRAYIRLKNYKALIIQRFYRKNKLNIEYYKKKMKSQEVIIGNKQRRRFSICLMRTLFSDYLNLNSKLNSFAKTVKSVCNLNENEYVYFSINLKVLTSRPMRSSKLLSRIFFITSNMVYILANSIEKKILQIKIEKRLSLMQINKLSLSTLMDDWIVFHTNEESDLILNCFFKTELVSIIKALNIHTEISFSNSIQYKKKNNKIETLKFNLDPNISMDTYKSHLITVPQGLDPNIELILPTITTKEKSSKVNKTRISMPNNKGPSPTFQPTDNPERYKTLYPYTSDKETELSFDVGDILNLKQKDPGGWWLCIDKDAREGWAPSNYLELIIEKNPPPSLPSPPPIPTKKKDPEVPFKPAMSQAPLIKSASIKAPVIPNAPIIPKKPASTLSNARSPPAKPNIPKRPENDDNTPKIPPKPSISQKPVQIQSAQSNIAALANALNGSTGKPFIPMRPFTNQDSDKPKIPQRPDSKPLKAPPKPPVPNRN